MKEQRSLMRQSLMTTLAVAGAALALATTDTQAGDKMNQTEPKETAGTKVPLKINFALLAEQVVSAQESDCPRRPIPGIASTMPTNTISFETKLQYLDKAEVSAYWLYGFRSAEGTMRDIGLLKAAKQKLERLGKEAYIVCEPVGHPNRNQKTLPARGWRHRINCDGTPDYGSADIEENLVRDLVAATTAFRDAGFKKVFFDDSERENL